MADITSGVDNISHGMAGIFNCVPDILHVQCQFFEIFFLFLLGEMGGFRPKSKQDLIFLLNSSLIYIWAFRFFTLILDIFVFSRYGLNPHSYILKQRPECHMWVKASTLFIVIFLSFMHLYCRHSECFLSARGLKVIIWMTPSFLFQYSYLDMDEMFFFHFKK